MTKLCKIVVKQALKRQLGSLCYVCENSNQSISERLIVLNSELQLDKEFLKPQHLYFTCDEEFKQDEWVYRIDTKSLWQWKDFHWERIGSEDVKQVVRKVIATTDDSLVLPTIQQDFIKTYVAANGDIDSVELELIIKEPFQTMAGIEWKYKLKLTENNEVIVVDNAVRIEGGELISKDGYVSTTALKAIVGNVININTVEQAAERYAKSKYSYNLGGRRIDGEIDFNAGAKWKEEQRDKENIEFLKWIETECSIRNGLIMHGLQSVPSSHETLYKIFKKSING